MLWAGGEWVAVTVMNTSRTCARCGHIKLEGLDTAEVQPGCESTARMVCEVNCERSSQQQEPTERAA